MAEPRSVMTNIFHLGGACYFGVFVHGREGRAKLLMGTEEWERQRLFGVAEAMVVDRMQIAREFYDSVVSTILRARDSCEPYIPMSSGASSPTTHR